MAITLAALSLSGRALAAPVETVLYRFSGSDGVGPYADLIFDKEGALYGTTELGGSGNIGTVFMLTPPTKSQTAWTETVLHSFTGGSDGLFPVCWPDRRRAGRALRHNVFRWECSQLWHGFQGDISLSQGGMTDVRLSNPWNSGIKPSASKSC
jgi:uncharacterized repeat protein (TIGR03803 family)